MKEFIERFQQLRHDYGIKYTILAWIEHYLPSKLSEWAIKKMEYQRINKRAIRP